MRRLACVLGVLLVAGCGSSGSPAEPTVYGASSLAAALPALDGAPHYSFGGSNELQLQIERGAPADVLAAAAPTQPQALFAAGRCEEPRPFATNRLVLLVPKANAAGVTSVADLAKGRLRLAVGAPGVPIGDYTREVIDRLGAPRILTANTVSLETSVAGILAKVVAGSADAGFAYATDARAARDKVHVVEIPAAAQPTVVYEACVVRRRGAHRAEAARFVDRLTGPEGQAVLRRYGFGPPPR